MVGTEGIEIREMTAGDYDRVVELWNETPGLGLSGADTRESITRYLARNPGMSLVARLGGELVGTVLCGHDGRRGYIHHLAVKAGFRRRGLGRELVRRCLLKLREQKIEKCHLFSMVDNAAGLQFWTAAGWTRRQDICVVSRDLDEII